MTISHTADELHPPFELKGSLTTLTELHLFDSNLKRVNLKLLKTVEQAPAMFQRMPVIIDLEQLTELGEEVDMETLCRLLRAQDLVPVAVRNASPVQEGAALSCGLGLLPASRKRSSPPPPPKVDETIEEEPHTPPEAIETSGQLDPHQETDTPIESQSDNTAGESDALPAALTSPPKVVRTPVRSGQRIYAPGSDLIVFAPVSAGAELIADGSIHVYGPLRGRALAGTRGDIHARIYCQALHAELLAVAGHYKLFEEPAEAAQGKPAQIYLDGEKLIIDSL